MIADQDIKSEIQSLWNGIHKMANVPRKYTVPLRGKTYSYPAAPKDFHNLPFLLAYSVLDSVLSELSQQGVFACGSWMLGKKMEASRSNLPWQDYVLIEKGREQRNALAHGSVLLSRDECLQYISAVERELIAWQVVV